MAVVPLTLAISLILVGTFIVFFLREHSRGASSSPERDSLLPLDEETSHVVEKNRETTDPPSPYGLRRGKPRPKLRPPTTKLQ